MAPNPQPSTELPVDVLLTTALTTLAALLIGLFLQMTLVGTLQHGRDQAIAYDDLRLSLAQGTAPVGPHDSNGKPLRPGTPLAKLSIPAIGLKEIALEGTSSGVLRSGVGHRRDSVYPGQAGTSILMGRRFTYGGPFAKIGSLGTGDDISVITGQGTATYKVVAVREPGDPSVPSSTARLTLITTSGNRFAPSDAIRVDADLVGTPFAPATPRFTSATLPAAEKPLQGDHSAMSGIVGWGILLCAAAISTQWLRLRWGRWQAWLIGVPTLGLFGIEVADHISQLLPNIL